MWPPFAVHRAVMKRLILSVGLLGVGLLASCAEREKQPEQTAPVPAPVVVQQSPVAKFKGLPVQKPMMVNVPPATTEVVPAAPASAAPSPK